MTQEGSSAQHSGSGLDPTDVVRVVLAEDDPRLQRALAQLIDSDPHLRVVGTAADGAAALALATAHHSHVVVTDVRMPGMDGLQLTRALRSGPRAPGAPSAPAVVVLTMFDDDGAVAQALDAGAAGFLLKNAPPEQVLHAIRAAHRGHALLAPEVTARLLARITSSRRSGRGLVGQLPARERQTLALVGQGLSNAEIAAAMVVTETTARTYVSRVMTRLGARDRAQLVLLAHQGGLVGDDPLTDPT